MDRTIRQNRWSLQQESDLFRRATNAIRRAMEALRHDSNRLPSWIREDSNPTSPQCESGVFPLDDGPVTPPFRLHGSRGPPCRRAHREHTARLCWSDPLLLAAGGGLEPPSDDSKSSALPLRRTRITFARAGGVEPPRREIWNLAGYRSLARMARGPRSRARRIERR